MSRCPSHVSSRTGHQTGCEEDFAGLIDYVHVGESFYYKEVHFKSQLPLGCWKHLWNLWSNLDSLLCLLHDKFTLHLIKPGTKIILTSYPPRIICFNFIPNWSHLSIIEFQFNFVPLLQNKCFYWPSLVWSTIIVGATFTCCNCLLFSVIVSILQQWT